jgi:carbamoyltransferase
MVHADTNPRFHALIERFKSKTGCPVLVNTSFNVRGEPIVCTPEDAFRCFMGNEVECSFSAIACCARVSRI